MESLSERVLDSLTASVAVVDRSGIIVATNEAWNQFAEENGADPNAVGIGVNYLKVCQETLGSDRYYAERAWQGIKDVLEEQRDVFALEYPCHSPTQQRWYLLHVSPLKDDPSRVVTVHLSITDRKRLENALVESAQLTAIGQAMQGLSHKGRNSLQHAQGFIDLLRCSVEHDPEAAELLDRVEGAQRRLIGLYEEVQRYAAPINLRRVPTRLDQLATTAWTALSQDKVDLAFVLQSPAFDVTCEVDGEALTRVIKSVFDNAISTDPKASRIEVSYRRDRIEERDCITMIISDDGPGISGPDRESVFEPFHTTKTIGSGLGLSIASRIVKAHGGRLVVGEPMLGGASIYLTLPIKKQVGLPGEDGDLETPT